MLVALIITVFAFTGLYLYLLQKAMAVEEARRELDDLKDVLRKGDD
jgi:heme exporter protein C